MVALIQLGAAPAAGSPAAAAATDAVPAMPGGGDPNAPMDPLNTVGLALLAYGLVQLLSKVIDKLPVGRAHDAAQPGNGGAGGGFTSDDRKRLERLLEQVTIDRQQLERLQEAVREIQDVALRSRGMSDQLQVNQRLIGQALDELRETQAKLDNVLRKLRSLWVRVGRRRKDKG
jgi:hypothetical protein